MKETAFERVTRSLREAGCRVVERGGQRAESTCPVHDDSNPSVSITGIQGRVLVYCHAGCSTAAIMETLWLSLADLYDDRSDTYKYDDGRVVHRYYDGGKKRFAQKGAQPIATLYRASRIQAAPTDQVVYLVEGEADVHAIEHVGGLSTTAPQGSGSFRKVDVSPLTDRVVVVVVDRDEAGDKWAAQVAAKLADVAARYDFVRARIGKDASDHIAAGHGLDAFEPYQPPDHPPEPDIAEQRDQASQLLDGAAMERRAAVKAGVEPESEPAPKPIVVALPEIRLPADIWEARLFFKHVHAAALATRTNPDAVLGAALAVVASMVPPGVRFDSGADPGEASGSVNLYTVLLATSGIGKSRSQTTAQKLLIAPRALCEDDGRLDPERYRIGGIGSGEGLIEAFMGFKERDAVGPKGKLITEKYRAQARGNAFISVDEGEGFNKLVTRTGSTLGPILRTAWNGGPIGQNNASAETTRFLPAGTYSLGLVIAYQPEVAADLLRDAGPGTPQRFLWFGTRNGKIVRERYTWPGRIELPDWPARATVTFDHIIEAELLDYDVDKHLGIVVVKELDSHEPLMWCKVAVLLALIEDRLHVTLEDWDLAKVIVSTSASARDRLAEQLEAHRVGEDKDRRESRVDDAMAIRAADVWVRKKAREIVDEARQAVRDGEVMSRKKARHDCKSIRRDRWDQALDLAIADGGVVLIGDEIRPRVGG